MTFTSKPTTRSQSTGAWRLFLTPNPRLTRDGHRECDSATAQAQACLDDLLIRGACVGDAPTSETSEAIKNGSRTDQQGKARGILSSAE